MNTRMRNIRRIRKRGNDALTVARYLASEAAKHNIPLVLVINNGATQHVHVGTDGVVTDDSDDVSTAGSS